jgi:hypothetical protein
LIRAHVAGVGVLAPGVNGWEEARAHFRGVQPWINSAMAKPNADLLAPTERRRATEATRCVLHVGEQALTAARLDHASAKTVFATVSAASEISHQICEALARSERDVSPTKFHNSVHNAPIGYWAIATQCRMASTALACFEGSFAAGLLEAAAQVAAESTPVLFISCDPPYCAPIQRQHPITATCAIALVLTPEEGDADLARIDLSLEPVARGSTSRVDTVAVPEFLADNPTAAGLPLLHALATEAPVSLTLHYLDTLRLRVDSFPC